MYKLLCFDVDGTLVEDGSNAIPEALHAKFSELNDLGVKMVIASGRGYGNLRSLFPYLIDEGYFLTDNGTKRYHRDRLESSDAMDLAKIEALVRRLEGMPDLAPLFSGPGQEVYLLDSMITDELQSFRSDETSDWERDLRVVRTLEEIPQPITHISLFTLHHLEEHGEALRPEFEEDFDIFLSGNVWIGFLAKGSGKGHALGRLMEDLGLGAEDCVFFGDQENDIGAFEQCETGFASLNSDETVKRVAERILPEALGAGVLRVLCDMQEAGQLPTGFCE